MSTPSRDSILPDILSDALPELDVSRKRLEMLQAAKLEFLDSGYEATSMDAVARRAGTTKRTLYAHFDSKDALYQEIASYAGRLFLLGVPTPDPAADDLAVELTSYCVAVLGNLAWGDAIALQRMIIGSHAKFPDLPPRLYEVSFGAAVDRLGKCLSAAARAKRITRPKSAKDAAHRLLLMTTGQVHMETLMGARAPLPGPPGPETYKAVDARRVRATVDEFLRDLT